mmetsp:Transcript_32069/g.79276  ORF Transcript_32069/g.79276 Transcript_32069/m.79276 type:complete len:190 (+) Transcript_32069:1335-1904(+)
MSCLLCPSSHLVIAASCTRHSSLRPSVSLHAAALHHARSHRHADYCVPSTALARACICSCPAAACSFRFHPSRTLPKNDLSCFICFTTFGHHRRSLHCIALHFSRVRAIVLSPLRLFPSSFIPADPSKPSCFLHSALSCFVSFILLLASHLVSIFAFFIGFPSCSRSVPRTHTRIYTKICSLKQWLFSM